MIYIFLFSKKWKNTELLKAKTEQKLNTEIISIDPMPRAEIDSLANKVITDIPRPLFKSKFSKFLVSK